MGKNDELNLNNTNILLISDDRDDYEAILNYQYKNVDYFPSYLVALSYFKEHRDLAMQYNVIFINEKIGRPLNEIYREPAVDFCYMCLPNDQENTPLVLSYYKFSHGNKDLHNLEVLIASPKRAYMTLYGNFNNFSELIHDYYLESGFKEENAIKDYKKIKIDNKLLFPEKIGDLKILFLGSKHMTPNELDDFNNSLSKMGIENCDYLEESDDTLEKKVITKLGDYDIILSSKLKSRKLLDFENEATLLATNSNRPLILLEIYQSDNKMHCIIDTFYSYAGTMKNEVKLEEDDLHDNSVIYNSSFSKKFNVYDYGMNNNEYLPIIETAVAKFIKASQSLGHEIHNDANYKFNSSEDYNNDFKSKIEIEAQNMKLYTSLNDMCHRYISYKKSGFITKDIPNINIDYMNPIYTINICDDKNKQHGVVLQNGDLSAFNIYKFILFEQDYLNAESLSLWITSSIPYEIAKKLKYPNADELEKLNKIQEELEKYLKSTLQIAEAEHKKSAEIINTVIYIRKLCDEYFNARKFLPDVPQVELSKKAVKYFISIFNETTEISRLIIPEYDIYFVYLASIDKNRKLSNPTIKYLRWAIDTITPNRATEEDIVKINAIKNKLNTYIKPLLDALPQSTNKISYTRNLCPKKQKADS